MFASLSLQENQWGWDLTYQMLELTTESVLHHCGSGLIQTYVSHELQSQLLHPKQNLWMPRTETHDSGCFVLEGVFWIWGNLDQDPNPLQFWRRRYMGCARSLGGPHHFGTYRVWGGLQYRDQHVHVLNLLQDDIHHVQDGLSELIKRHQETLIHLKDTLGSLKNV